MDDALRQSEEKYRVLFDSIDEGFCIIEMLFADDGSAVDYRFLEVNPAFEAHTGLRNATGKLMRELEPEHEQHWFDIYGNIALTGEPQRFVQEAGHLGGRWFDVYAFRVGDPEQRKVGVLFRDISERKRMEAERREADRMKDEFLAILGHELRNPLAPLQTSLYLLERTSRSPDYLDHVIPMMHRQLAHLVRLVDDLLDISRVSRGKIELQSATLDLGDPVHSAVEQVRTVIRERNHTLEMRLSPGPLLIHGDFERLTQVVANLLSNAAKYTRPGGTITLATGSESGHAFINVRDNGLGIPPTAMDGLFQMFSQVDEHRSHEGGGGLGVGLALSRHLIELHGGKIEVHSAGLGCGSEFIVRLPLDQGRAPQVEDLPGDSLQHTPKRIVIVDDNVDAAEALRMLLETRGHTVATAYDGPSALALIARFQPDTLLLDLGLPGMDGIEVARRVQSSDHGKKVQIVAITGWAQDSDRHRTQLAGFDHHLTKPVQMRLLDQVLSQPGEGI